MKKVQRRRRKDRWVANIAVLGWARIVRVLSAWTISKLTAIATVTNAQTATAPTAAKWAEMKTAKQTQAKNTKMNR